MMFAFPALCPAAPRAALTDPRGVDPGPRTEPVPRVRPFLALLLALFPTTLQAAEASHPRFTDRSAALPVRHSYDGGWEHFVGGGAAVMDCNGDDRPDVYAAGGSAPSHLFVNATPRPGAPIRFTLGTVPDITEVTGAYPLDLDADGVLDLYVMRVGPNVALKGLGDCRFEDATSALGLPEKDQWTTAFSATWEGANARPTLAVGNYVDRFDPDGPFFACDTSWLLRPGREGYGAEELTPSFCPLSMLVSDWQRSGTPDLRVSNDRQYYVRGGYEQMFHLSPLHEYGEDEGWRHVSLWGMGIASRDITGDGRPEVMLTSMGDQLLQFNDPGGWRDAPYSVGVTAQRPFRGDDGRPSTGWHAEFGDVDNDGMADLFIAKGNVEEMPSNAMHDPNNLLMQQADGTFREAATEAGVDSMAKSRGAALVDFDGDGRLDILVVNRRAPLEVWQNATPGTGHWLEVTLQQPGGNARAVGAWVELRTDSGPVRAQEVTVGGGHASGHARGLHFGLGAAETAEVRVTWPGGAVSPWQRVPADRRVVLAR